MVLRFTLFRFEHSIIYHEVIAKYNSISESMINKIKYHYRIYKSFGYRAVWFLLSTRFSKERNRNIKIKGIRYPLNLSNFNVDVKTLFQIFFAKEYEFPVHTVPTCIVDCGANIGLSTIYFANKFPDAKIIAVEPDDNNFSFLQMNSRFYKNIICLKSAVWSKPVTMAILDPGRGSWGFQTVESNSENGISGITIDQIVNKFHCVRIDILKVDIEGAEKQIFSSGFENWLSITKCIAIELHDNFVPGASEAFFNAIAHRPYNGFNKGENFICQFLD